MHEVVVTPGFFDTVGIPLLAGRLLNEIDDESAAPVAVVNKATLGRLWPGVKDPLGLLALALAVIGIYGVMTYNVTQRYHEMGVRMALGATTGDAVRLILRHGMSLVAGGILAGALLGFGLARSMRAMLWDVALVDPVTYLAVAALLAVVALGANLVPARRVTAVDPVSAMRDE